MTTNKLLHEILQIIHFLDNKEKFIQEFEELNHQETLANLLNSFPHETQKTLKSITDQHVLIGELRKHLSQQQFSTELIRVSHSALMQFLKDIEHTLSDEQKKEIAALIEQR